VITAITAAAQDVRAGLTGPVPAHLRDAHYPGAGKLGHGRGYQYPHDQDEGIVAQQYAPDELAGREYYRPSRHGAESRYAERAEKIRAILARAPRPGQAPER
jgi:putative ATPase